MKVESDEWPELGWRPQLHELPEPGKHAYDVDVDIDRAFAVENGRASGATLFSKCVGQGVGKL